MNDLPLRLDGIFPPIPTPFDQEGQLALDALSANLTHWNQYGLRGYVVLGTNGEYVYLTQDEKLQVLATAREAIPDDRLLIAGTGCEATQHTIELTQQAAEIGADAALVITPSYYTGRMTAEAQRSHYRAVADASPIPILIYNMPANTGIDLDAQTVATLAQHPNIIGIKESGGNVVKIGHIHHLTGADFQIMAGSASFLLPGLAMGAIGGILALANIAPELCLALRQHVMFGQWSEARELQVRLIPVNNAVTRNWGVAGLKAAMDMLGLYGGPVRPPLLPLDDRIEQELRSILVEAGILEVS